MRFLILFIISFSAFANFKKQSDVGTATAPRYTTIKKCGKDCIKLPKNYNPHFYNFGEHQVDDKSKPKFTKVSVQTCATEEDCQTLNAAKACDVGQDVVMRLDLDPMEVYCAEPNGFEQKTVTGLYVDESAKSSYESSQAEKQAKEAGIAMVIAQRACGQRVLDFISVLNAQKNITVEQTRQMLSLFGDIRIELKEGALETAKNSLQNIDVIQILLDQSDIDKIIAELNGCM